MHVQSNEQKHSTSAPHILIVAGESSGDMHAARLIHELRIVRPGISVSGIGGKELEQEGATLLYTAAQMNVVGFTEVVKRIGFFRRVMGQMLYHAQATRPTLAILVDYPGFNLRLARALKKLGIPVLYYIAPQVWAWKEGRTETIRKYVDDLIVAFPFETEYFARHNIQAHYFGHPLVDRLEAETERRVREVELLHSGDPRRIITYLPGSRPEEIHRHMPIVAEAARTMGDEYRHIIPLASTVDSNLLRQFITGTHIEVVGDAHIAIAAASVAIVKSGTSTVETALLGTPFAVMYKASPLTYRIARAFIKVPSIAMVNILAGRPVVQELIQKDLTPDAVVAELRMLLMDSEYRRAIEKGIAEVRALLGQPGASARAASFIAERYL